MANPFVSLDFFVPCPLCGQEALVLNSLIRGQDVALFQCLTCGATGSGLYVQQERMTPNHGTVTVLTPKFGAGAGLPGATSHEA